MKSRNKASRAVSWGLVGLLGLVNIGCDGEMSKKDNFQHTFRHLLEDEMIIYHDPHKGGIALEMDALELFARDFESPNDKAGGKLNSHIQEDMRLKSIVKHKDGYQIRYVNEDSTKCFNVFFERIGDGRKLKREVIITEDCE